MHRRTSIIPHLSLIAVIVLSLVATGCGGTRQAGESPVETKVAETVPTPLPEGEEAAEGEGEETSIEGALDRIRELAPLHVTSAYEYKTGDEVSSKGSYEADIDAQGNQHLFMESQDGQKTELYLVDRKLYIGAGDGQFMGTGEVEDEAGITFLATFGGAFLLGFNNLEGARRVGSETVNGFDCDKYEFQYNLAGAGLGGAVAGAQGADWQYQAFAWIEKETKAVIRGQVDWKSKAADSDVTQTFHSEFEATKGTVETIEAPENVIGAG